MGLRAAVVKDVDGYPSYLLTKLLAGIEVGAVLLWVLFLVLSAASCY